MMSMKMPITVKLALASVSCVLVVMVIFSFFSYVSEKNRLEVIIDGEAGHSLSRLVGSLRSPLYNFDRSQLEAVLSMEISESGIHGITVFDSRDKVYAAKWKNEAISLGNNVREEGGGPGYCYRLLESDITADEHSQEQIIGRVKLCLSDVKLRESLDSMLVRMVASSLLVSAFLCICIFVVLRYVLLRPILNMRVAVARFEQMDFSSRTAVTSDDELGQLGRSFNTMASTIQNYSEHMEQTIAERTLELTQKNEIIVLEKELAEAATQAKTRLLAEQEVLIRKLEDAQGQLLQSEKMASVGQLAAGVAHEINNPIGFINSNLNSLKKNVDHLLKVIAVYEKAETALSGHLELLEAIKKAKSAADLDFLQDDMQSLIAESIEGVQRVKKIVDNLKDFSRIDTAEWQFANLEKGLDSTLNIVWNELKYKAEVKKEYAGLPEIECIASQLNQVFMNLMVNAAHAITERGVITLRTGFDEHTVWVEVEDTGAGIKPEHLNRIFEPFFTTKPIGKGTGLGLSLAYSIVQRHHGKLGVQSEEGKGTVFRVTLPRERLAEDVCAC